MKSIMNTLITFTHKCMCGTMFKSDTYLAKCPNNCDGLVRSFKKAHLFSCGDVTCVGCGLEK